MDAFLSIRSFQPQGPAAFPAWLARIAQNNLLTAIHALAAQRRPDPRERVQLPRGDESCVALLDALCSTKSSPSRSAARHEARFILEEAIGQLAEAHRQVVRLYDLEGRPAAAVAAAMGRSEGAIYMLRARAHEQLREILGSSSGFFSDAS